MNVSLFLGFFQLLRRLSGSLLNAPLCSSWLTAEVILIVSFQVLADALFCCDLSVKY